MRYFAALLLAAPVAAYTAATDAPTSTPQTQAPTQYPSDPLATCAGIGCGAGQVCEPGPFEDEPAEAAACATVACSLHLDCATHILPGSLPYCRGGLCDDSLGGTCAAEEQCAALASRHAPDNVGSVRFAPPALTANATEALLALAEIAASAQSTFPETQMRTFVYSNEVASIIGGAFVTLARDDAAAARAAVADAFCGDLAAHCAVAIELPSYRRRLQSGGMNAVVATISFAVDLETLRAMIANGVPSDDEFTQALAAALSISIEDISASASEATLEVEFIVGTGSDGENPVDESVLQEMALLKDAVPEIADAVYTALGIYADGIGNATLDLCAFRHFDKRCELSAVCRCT
ncbi:Hypothetical Protein FCC1311_048362 [Hondaea fermentalgiana]|uniref:Uncharacterized protein n=1 Tax=Hondaea fermentalgiana TaxID=2315210 RepID=A0A2R5GDG9_9STRA|nr:Hypothetical Protein FCC1311_048362 [Hondaea fermentalgiana]|eukprot:GBG28615.1 Hypothetical Protein FCC1311_048362 [Hondaea fermentalgiana]